MQVQDQIKKPEDYESKVSKPGSVSRHQSRKSQRSKVGAAGWVGAGILALCGICCSFPFLIAIGTAIGTTALLSLAWPVIGLGLTLILGIVIVWQLRKYRVSLTTRSSSPTTAACNSTPLLLTQPDSNTTTTATCRADGSCGCKK